MSDNNSNLLNLNALSDNLSLAPLGCSCPDCQSQKNSLDTSGTDLNLINNINKPDGLILKNNLNQIKNKDLEKLFSGSSQNRWDNLLANVTTQTTTTSTGVTAAATISGSGDPQIDGILSSYKWGFSWGTKQLSYSFYEDTVFNGTYYGSETGVREVSEGVKTNVRSILNWLENVIDIDFVEVTETSNNMGRMRFMLSNAPSYAYAYYPSSDSMTSVTGDVHLNPNYDRLGDTNGFQNAAGQHGYMSLVHEIGHALGLKHPFDGTPTLPGQEDNTTNTVMTYNFTGNSAGTYMGFDVKALQYMYGAKAYNATDTAYQFTTRVDQFSVGGQLSLNAPNLTKQLIWDSGGQDTLDFSSLSASTGYRFDLTPGGILTTQAAYNGTSYTANSVSYKTTTYGTAIGYNVIIENLVNSSSNDEIFANSAANRFTGYSPTRITGNDIYWNTTSADLLDLSSYNSSNVTQTASGSDLILGLGSNGTITVKNYYQGNAISLLFSNSITASINDVTLTEGNSGTTQALFTVSLSGPSTQTTTLNYSTANGTGIAGSDYIGANGLLTFAAGETSKTIAVDVLGDLNYEANETFRVNLTNPSSNVYILDGEGIGTINNDEAAPPNLFINDVTVNEGNNAILTVNLSSASAQTVSLNFATANGSAITGQDYNSSTGTLTFNPGETSKTITIGTIDDTVYEPTTETFAVNLSSAVNGVITDSQGIVSIAPSDGQPVISISSVSATEGSTTNNSTKNFNFTVSLSNASNQNITVQYATANGTAAAGSDYITQGGTLTFNAGTTTRTISVAVYQDRTIEQNENFIINLTNPTNATLGVSQGIGTITNDDLSTTSTKTNGKVANTIIGTSSLNTSPIAADPLSTQFQGILAATGANFSS